MSLKSLVVAGRKAETTEPPAAPVVSLEWSERRAFYRQAVSWPARCRARDARGVLCEHLARVRDISHGGARIHLDCFNEIGDIVEVEVRQQGLVFRSHAAVLARKVEDCGLEVRVRFENLSLVARDVLLALTARTIRIGS